MTDYITIYEAEKLCTERIKFYELTDNTEKAKQWENAIKSVREAIKEMNDVRSDGL